MRNQKIPDSTLIAAVRSGVICSLLPALADLHPEGFADLRPPSRPAGLSLRGGSVHRRLYLGWPRRRSGNTLPVLELSNHSAFFPAAILNFITADGMVQKLSGRNAPVLPIPTGIKALQVIGFFSRASAEISRIMSGSFPVGGPEYTLQTKMLLTAALRGVCEVGLHDPWTASKSRRLPLGVLEVRAGHEENPAFCGYIVRSEGRHGLNMSYHRGSEREAIIPGSQRATALLHFEDLHTAGEVLRGLLPAMEALGSGQVKIRGKIPYIQGIFPLLDRFSEIMNAGGIRKE